MCVLVVEDEALILMDVSDALEQAGHEVLPVANGAQALRAIERFNGRFSALITDHRMPGGIYGSELAANMRAIYPNVPIIIATGTPSDISDDFRSQYNVCVVPKPYLASQLVRKLPPPVPPTGAWA